MAMEPSPVLVAIREELARLESAAALGPPLDDEAMAELYPLLAAAGAPPNPANRESGRSGLQPCRRPLSLRTRSPRDKPMSGGHDPTLAPNRNTIGSRQSDEFRGHP
jgi:hypothetical protein